MHATTDWQAQRKKMTQDLINIINYKLKQGTLTVYGGSIETLHVCRWTSDQNDQAVLWAYSLVYRHNDWGTNQIIWVLEIHSEAENASWAGTKKVYTGPARLRTPQLLPEKMWCTMCTDLFLKSYSSYSRTFKGRGGVSTIGERNTLPSSWNINWMFSSVYQGIFSCATCEGREGRGHFV